jgi:hypothetical protein
MCTEIRFRLNKMLVILINLINLKKYFVHFT